jgi:hypothetical protein
MSQKNDLYTTASEGRTPQYDPDAVGRVVQLTLPRRGFDRLYSARARHGAPLEDV